MSNLQIPDGYRQLQLGEQKAIGDKCWTWLNVDCTEVGWQTIESICW
jgi:hypothetical protein